MIMNQRGTPNNCNNESWGICENNSELSQQEEQWVWRERLQRATMEGVRWEVERITLWELDCIFHTYV